MFTQFTFLIICISCSTPAVVPRNEKSYSNSRYYLRQCSRSDPNINECIADSANLLSQYFQRGIPELGIQNVEPVVIDEIHLALGSGPKGYRATFRDIEAYGVSNLTVTAARSDLSTNQFQFTFYVPKISVRGHYKSAGVLIMVPATGGGEYWGEYEGVKAKIYLRASEYLKGDGKRYLKTEELKMDFSVRDLKMGIEKVENGNQLLEAALNLFINANAQELLKEMKPDIRKKLLAQMKIFLDDHLFAQIPLDDWIVN